MTDDAIYGSVDQTAEVISLVTREPVEGDDSAGASGWLRRLCRTASHDLPASGVGVSLLSTAGELVTAAASDARSVSVEELQFTLGEGPCLAAHEARAPVLVPDLRVMANSAWPAYAPAAENHGVAAVFAFPMQIGSARLGVLDVYRDRTGELSAPALARAMTYADVAMRRLLDTPEQPSALDSLVTDATDGRLQVYQAQGMVMVQLDVSLDEALARIRAHAYAYDRSIGEVADDIIARRITLERDGR